jgi:hypothetical protein
MEQTVNTLGGHVQAPRCQAKAKHSGGQCRKAAMRGKAVCRSHVGASTGPKTEAGRQHCAAARTVHGLEGRETRRVRAAKPKELRELETLMLGVGMLACSC